MNINNTLLSSIKEMYINFATASVSFLSKTILVLIIMAIGWYVAAYIKKVVEKLLNTVDLNKILSSVKIDKFVAKIGYKLDASYLIGEVARWVLFLMVTVFAFKIVSFADGVDFIQVVLVNGLKIIVAIVIASVSIFVARFLSKVASKVIGSMDSRFKNVVANISSAVVYFFTLILILNLFEITQPFVEYINMIFMASVMAVSIAVGLAFGLGGKDMAKDSLEKWIEKIKK